MWWEFFLFCWGVQFTPCIFIGTVLIYKTYKCLHDQSPNYMYRLRYVNDFNNYATRNSTENMLFAPKHRVDIFKQAYQYTAPV